MTRPYIASIAGYDPSGGAGVLADVKTFEAFKLRGLAVCTAMTWQNDVELRKVAWQPIDEIQAQLDLLLARFNVGHFKIGIVRDWQMLTALCDCIRSKKPGARILWDPVIASSSGFSFINKPGRIEDLTGKVDVLTPNWKEGKTLFSDEQHIKTMSEKLIIYLKGGHREDQPGLDQLFVNGSIYPLRPKSKKAFAKHGSGCVFSAAFLAALAKGLPTLRAALKAKRYVEYYLGSTKELLGYHKL